MDGSFHVFAIKVERGYLSLGERSAVGVISVIYKVSREEISSFHVRETKDVPENEKLKYKKRVQDLLFGFSKDFKDERKLTVSKIR